MAALIFGSFFLAAILALFTACGGGDSGSSLPPSVTVPDGEDNCPLTSNPRQSDSDQDGRGDSCDEDTDGDGVGDVEDNCPADVNPEQTNNDGDLLHGPLSGRDPVCLATHRQKSRTTAAPAAMCEASTTSLLR